jgi:hypothetical protein
MLRTPLREENLDETGLILGIMLGNTIKSLLRKADTPDDLLKPSHLPR